MHNGVVVMLCRSCALIDENSALTSPPLRVVNFCSRNGLILEFTLHYLGRYASDDRDVDHILETVLGSQNISSQLLAMAVG